MPKYVNANKSNTDLIAVCDEALRQRQAGQVPVVNGVRFEHAAALGWCQQHVREAVEACAFGAEGLWGGASCCATSTHQKLTRQGYTRVSWEDAMSGDLIYWSPCGIRCGTCRQDAGHTGILHHVAGSGAWWIWQNTSSGGRGICIIPIQSWQYSPVGIYRAFPLAAAAEQPALTAPPGGEKRVNWHGEYLDPADVLFEGGKHYVAVRAAAAAEGLVVKVDAATGKVFVGPPEWWPEEQP